MTENSGAILDKFFEALQRIIGGGLFLWLYYNDRNVDLSLLSTVEVLFLVGQYSAAFALLKAFTSDEIIRVIEAVRGRQK